MSYHNSHSRSRLPRANTQESHRSRRHRSRVHKYQGPADHEQWSDQNTVGHQPSILWSAPLDRDATAVSRSDTSVSGTYAFSAQAVCPEWAIQDSSDVDGASNSNHYPVHSSAVREPAWEGSPATYQPTPHDQAEVSMPHAVSPTDKVSVAVPETTYSQTEPTPLFRYQAWAGRTHRDSAIETDVVSDRMDRRWSMQARQGSVVGPSGNVAAPISMNPSGTVEEQDSSDASADTPPVDRDHIVHGFLGGKDTPWSPEFPHQEPSYRYTF
ncbi:hypothetical protein F5B21DRAFT_41930 [Xylaria acuta]|nr:hypothetical protein F5B21DRAFT_41930 [Xylaria acuta]